MIGSANDFAAERIYKAPAVNAFVGSSNRNRARFALLRGLLRGGSVLSSPFLPFSRFKVLGDINHGGNFWIIPVEIIIFCCRAWNERADVGSFPETLEIDDAHRSFALGTEGRLKNALWALNRLRWARLTATTTRTTMTTTTTVWSARAELAYIVQLSLVAREHAIW